jgi:hypothetical protein
LPFSLVFLLFLFLHSSIITTGPIVSVRTTIVWGKFLVGI